MEFNVLERGRFRARLENGELRYIRYGGVEIIRGIYAAVRDRDWNTVPPRLTDVQIREGVEETVVTFSCEHTAGEIDFVWRGIIRFSAQEICYGFDGRARTAFQKNRIGFCVLHPMEFAGLAVHVQTADGPVEGIFPEEIAPHQPFKAIRSMVYEPVPHMGVTVSFEGDRFEMEDQRNWTDASYKTYCTPLDLPCPVPVYPGESIRQSVTVRVRDELPAMAAAPAIAAASATSVPGEHTIVLHATATGRLPGIGFVLAEGVPEAEWEQMLCRLRPDHLRLVLDLTRADWSERLTDAAAFIACKPGKLELEVLLGEDEPFRELAERIAQTGLPVCRMIPFRRNRFVSDSTVLRVARQAIREAGLDIPLGGGTRTFYAELNRAALPAEEIDFVVYSVNPQVHAFDDLSLMETLAAQSVTVRDARRKSGKPVFVGPVTFKPRLNPNAVGESDILPADQADPRQRLAFGAAWTLGSIAALVRGGAAGITYYETWGPIGLIQPSGVTPIYQVFQDIMEFSGASILNTECASQALSCLALASGSRRRLLTANVTDRPVHVRVLPGIHSGAGIRVYIDGAPEPIQRFRVPDRSGEYRLCLAPYGHACLDYF